MTPRDLPAAARRGLAVALLLAVAALLAAALVLPLRELAALDAALAREAREFARLEARATERAALQNERRILLQAGRDNRNRLEAATTGLAGAELQQIGAEVVEAAGGRLDSSQVLAVKREGKLTRVGLRLTTRLDVAALREVLYALESGRPLLYVSRLSVLARQRAPVPGGEEDRPILTITLDIYGYMGGEEG